MGKLRLNIAGIAGDAFKFLVMISGAVVFDRVKTRAGELNARIGALELWRDEHISGIQPHTDCVLQDRREAVRECLQRIERKIDRLEERIDTLMEKIHERG